MPCLTVDARMVKAAGIGTYLRHLLPRLMAKSPGWKYFLLGKKEELDEFPWACGPQATLIPYSRPIYSPREQLEIPSRIPSETDLYWQPHYNIPLFYRGKLLATVHDLLYLDEPGIPGGFHKHLYARRLFSALRKKADGILCVSGYTKERLLFHTGKGKAEPVVVYNGIDESWFKAARGDAPHGKPYLLYVGSVKPHKNLARLAGAFQTLLNRIPHDLLIVGKKEGLITGDPKALSAAEKLGPRVRFTGDFDHDDPRFRQFYLHAQALILPSLYEPFGLPALEAMACGCPVLLSNAPALPEVYGDAAEYFDPRDTGGMARKIEKVLSDPALRASLAKRGTERARLYHWDKSADKTFEVIQKIIQPDPRVRRR